jgi:tetraacyldisaccharide 4'-kinase
MRPKPLLRRFSDGVLAPAGWAFHVAGRLRADYYADPARRVSLGVPCISVGNLTFGGTGKTPFTVFLVRECLRLGFAPAVLLRGYGRKTHGPLGVRPDSGWEQVGDEALVLAANLPGVPVIVGERRERAAELAPAGTDLFILDDGFQHLRLRRDLDVVLIDASRPEDLAPPPRGRLREPLEGLFRAHLLVLTHGCDRDMTREVALLWAGRPRVGARFGWEERSRPDEVPWESLREVPCVAFSGIANPDTFFDQARERGIRIAQALAFPDHAHPDPARRDSVLSAARAAGVRWVLCTEKDHVKWAREWPAGDLPLRCPRLSVRIEDPGACLVRLLEALRGPV